MAALDTAGMPDDEPFRTAIREHVEFGSHVAMQNSNATTDDELLLLRMMLPAQQVDAMLASERPALARPPLVALVEGLTSRRELAVRPDLALYFRVPIDVSVDRLMARRVKLKFYEAGMDLGWSANPVESFRLFQGKVLDEYDQLVDEFGLQVVDAAGSITDQQRIVRQLITQNVQTSTVEIPDDESVTA